MATKEWTQRLSHVLHTLTYMTHTNTHTQRKSKPLLEMNASVNAQRLPPEHWLHTEAIMSGEDLSL